ncbi:preprotein translocase subunit YajC [Clostridium mediterraneense]|uniref:preprotein translocase subunit YajC n=1 Tax=Clostridium mediterraneense TaxID=1805472 RepID=UPI00082D8A41|nr:preprotein translocase subunit YajC [Clostridium mediterraneense]
MDLQSMLVMFGPIILMFVVFYLLMVVPEKKRQKKYKQMLDDLKVNDRVLTRGGIIGKIIKLNTEDVIIESETTRFKITRDGISSKIEK